jgi:probable phosphoglycerate mutase
MVTYITLLRHGETLWNATERWQGMAPVPLNDTGIEQAQNAAFHLQKAGITHIISSNFSRAYKTAAIVAEMLNLPHSVDPRWREIDVGRWQGMSWTEIKTWDPEAYHLFTSVSYMERAFPNGETQVQHMQRTVEALESIIQDYANQHVLVVTHGGSIRCVHYHLTHERGGEIGNCHITRLKHDADTNGQGWRIINTAQPPEAILW